MTEHDREIAYIMRGHDCGAEVAGWVALVALALVAVAIMGCV